MKKVLSLVMIAVPILAIIVGIVLSVKFAQLTPQGTRTQVPQVQCAHWSIFRCSQLLGVPIGMDYLIKKLPYQEKGHSMLQMSKVLNEIGFETEGRKETIQTLSNQKFPCIAHLTNPGHFVVVSGIDDKYVHVFDESGSRIAREHGHFAKQWSGNVLLVSKPSTAQRLPAFLSPPKGDVPLAEFESLIRDLGTVPAVGEPVVFRYSVKNVGRSDLIIKKIRPDCTCIESKKPEAPIKPGEVGTIDLLYHVQPQRGPFSHMVLIETNDPQIPMQAVMASGWSGVELRVEPPRITLIDLVSDQEKTYRCFVQYTGEGQDLRVQIENSSLEGAGLVSHVLKPITKEVVAEWFPEFG